MLNLALPTLTIDKSVAKLMLTINKTISIAMFLIAIVLIASMSLSAQATANTAQNHFNKMTFNDYTSHCKNDSQAYSVNDKTLAKPEIECLRKKLHDFQKVSSSAYQQYFSYKAEAWLDYAYRTDGIHNDPSIQSQAQHAATTILQALQNSDEERLNLNQDIPSYSTMMRPDLWALLSALKDNGGIENAARELAYSEVALIWAASDYCLYNAVQKDIGVQFRAADYGLEKAREAYINAHDSQTNVALENKTVMYFKQFTKEKTTDNECSSQKLPFDKQTLIITNKISFILK